MLHSHFQLERRPFTSVPSPDHYFAASSIEQARSSLVRLIERCEGPGLVIGGVGSGKSILCRLIAESFRHRCRVINLPTGQLESRRALLQVILYELGLPYVDQDESELRLALIDHVTNVDHCPNGILLLVDEADNLASVLLDELRSFTNLSSNEGHPAIRLILFGTSQLEEEFAHPQMESFNQRIAGRFYLEPFSSDETAEYVRQQFEDCGGDAQQVFTDNSLGAIHQATGGIPRLINQLTDHALVIAAANNQLIINDQTVTEAWADLQQLPVPVTISPETESLPSDIIEYGVLEPEKSAESMLASIEENVDLAHDPFEPVDQPHDIVQLPNEEDSGQESEPSLQIRQSDDPFGHDFDEEIVVVDRFVSPDALSQRHRRQVEHPRSHEFAQALLPNSLEQASKELDQAGALDGEVAHGTTTRNDEPTTVTADSQTIEFEDEANSELATPQDAELEDRPTIAFPGVEDQDTVRAPVDDYTDDVEIDEYEESPFPEDVGDLLLVDENESNDDAIPDAFDEQAYLNTPQSMAPTGDNEAVDLPPQWPQQPDAWEAAAAEQYEEEEDELLDPVDVAQSLTTLDDDFNIISTAVEVTDLGTGEVIATGAVTADEIESELEEEDTTSEDVQFAAQLESELGSIDEPQDDASIRTSVSDAANDSLTSEPSTASEPTTYDSNSSDAGMDHDVEDDGHGEATEDEILLPNDESFDSTQDSPRHAAIKHDREAVRNFSRLFTTLRRRNIR